ncbi:hypothetical protein FS842_001854, partial [Serendipita sp. 407]
MIYSKLLFALFASVLVAQAAPIPQSVQVSKRAFNEELPLELYKRSGAQSPTTSTSSGDTIDNLPS